MQQPTDNSAPADFLAPATAVGGKGLSSMEMPNLHRHFDESMGKAVFATLDEDFCDGPGNDGCLYCWGPETD